MSEKVQTKFGFISVIGSPNVGKSTLVNDLCDSKVSIVSPKVQTTRSRVKAITILNDTQIVFVDTPGIFKINSSIDNRLNRSIVLTAKNSLEGVDYLALVIDVSRKLSENDKYILELVKSQEIKKVLILNKVDKTDKTRLLDISAKLNSDIEFERTFMISALKGEGTRDILDFFAENLPDSPWMYPEDQISDISMRLLSAEVTREKLFFNLQKELPYSIYVETETFEEKPKSININQAIYVKTESQKKIILGKKGSMIKRIGEQSRRELSKIMSKNVNLFLFVKVRENWMENKEIYGQAGIDFSD